jgi:hypothetical protein
VSRVGIAVIAFVAGGATARCERDDYLKLEVLSSPTRGTLLVAVGSSRRFGEVLVLGIFGHWHVLIERWYTV